MYYPTGTLRARHSVAGRRMLYDLLRRATACRTASCGKLVVAADEPELGKIEQIAKQGAINGVEGLDADRRRGGARLEPELVCAAALYSPETGIVDSHAYMLALRGDLEDAGGMIAFNTPVRGARAQGGGWLVRFGGAEAVSSISTRSSIPPGLGAQSLARAMPDYPADARAAAGARQGQLLLLRGPAGFHAAHLSRRRCRADSACT